MTSEHFSEAELACNCPCRVNAIAASFLDRLERLRGIFDRPMPVYSGYRCPQHNSVVSSTGTNGPHTTGRAADIGVRGHDAFRLIALASECGFTGIGVQQKGLSRFVHVDDLIDGPGRPRPWLWSY